MARRAVLAGPRASSTPDAVPLPGCLDAMWRAPAEWDAWTGVLMLPDGEHINNGGGAVHFLGLAWSGRYGQPDSSMPRDPFPTGFLSGGCAAVRREVWTELGGFPEHYGACHEDVELSLRLALEGRRFGVLPDARAVHQYDFVKSPGKWQQLECNRWKTVLRTYPTPVLLAVLVPMLAAEPAVLAVGVRRGWARAKLRSWLELARATTGMYFYAVSKLSFFVIQVAMTSLAILFSTATAAVLFDEVIHVRNAVGAALIVGGLVLVFWR